MSEDVFSSPQASLKKERNKEVPEEILRKIRMAWMVGTVSIFWTVVFTLISMSGTDILGLDAYAFVDIFLMGILTFGIYKKSRVCAIFMPLLFAANNVIIWFEVGTVSGLPGALIFLWFYIIGVVGTFQFHSFKKQKNA